MRLLKKINVKPMIYVDKKTLLHIKMQQTNETYITQYIVQC